LKNYQVFEKLWKKILRRRALSLWAIPAFILFLVSLFYRVIVILNRSIGRKKVKLDIPVISIGNITVGGTGKTPILATVARYLISEGFKIGVVSSAYGRMEEVSIVKRGYEISDLPVSQTGDEVMLLAELLPEAIFSLDKTKSIAALNLSLSESKPDIMLVDDGFQHFRLHRDFDIVTYDAGIKAPHLKMFPYGVLREPKSTLKHADAIIITRAKFAKDIAVLAEKIKKIAPDAKIFSARFHTGDLITDEKKLSNKYLEDKSVMIFAGIGNFGAFHKQVRALTSNLDCALELSDHQNYNNELLNRIKRQADEHESEILVTTAKDWYKVRHFDFGRELYYLSQEIDLDPGEEKLVELLIRHTGVTRKAG
jgi:tetraacyldisaccharide 4'-kinase